jgi:hypothetical protein
MGFIIKLDRRTGLQRRKTRVGSGARRGPSERACVVMVASAHAPTNSSRVNASWIDVVCTHHAPGRVHWAHSRSIYDSQRVTRYYRYYYHLFHTWDL